MYQALLSNASPDEIPDAARDGACLLYTSDAADE